MIVVTKHMHFHIGGEPPLRVRVTYDTKEPAVVSIHLPDGEDRSGSDNVWSIGRELFAEVLIDDQPYSGFAGGDVIVSYGDEKVTKLSISNETVDEYLELTFSTKDMKRFLDLSYLHCSRTDEYKKSADILISQLKDWLMNNAS